MALRQRAVSAQGLVTVYYDPVNPGNFSTEPILRYQRYTATGFTAMGGLVLIAAAAVLICTTLR